MILFFDGISTNGYIWLYKKNWTNIDQKKFFISWNESSQAIWVLHKFLEENKRNFSEISDIVCVNGPWSFTWVRTITLIVNTLSYMYSHIHLTPISFFDLYNTFPIIKASSKRDLFVKYSNSDIIRIEKNEIFLEKNKNTKNIFWDIHDEKILENFNTSSVIDYEKIIQSINLTKTKIIEPLYIKKPNIS